MNTRQLELRIGAAALLGGLLVLTLSLAFGADDEAPPTLVQVDFPAAAGLKVGSKVSIAGVPAGEVTALSAFDGAFDHEVGRRVYVRADLAFDAEMAKRIRQDSDFVITTEGMLGERYVEITPAGTEAPALQGGVILPGSRSFQQKEFGENAGAVSRVIGRLVTRHQGPLSGFGEDLGVIVDKSGGALERMEGLVQREEPKLEALATRMMDTAPRARMLGEGMERAFSGVSLRRVAGALTQVQARLTKGAKAIDGDVDITLERFSALEVVAETMATRLAAGADTVQDATRRIPADLRAIQSLITSAETSLGALLSDREFLDDVLGLTKDVKRHPWKLLMRWEH